MSWRRRVEARRLASSWERDIAGSLLLDKTVEVRGRISSDDFVFVHGRYSNTGLTANWVVVDIVRIENGVLAEHWDVIQDEATREQSKSGNPMFGDEFPAA